MESKIDAFSLEDEAFVDPPLDVLVCECGAAFFEPVALSDDHIISTIENNLPTPDGECPECGLAYFRLTEGQPRADNREGTIQRKFADFHRAHPEVYAFLVTRARRMLLHGRERGSINQLFELARWHFEFEYDPEESFKLNNNYRSRYSRLIMSREEDLKGFFELRKLKAK